ncbi:MAG: TatD family nuclease-associated radical SAM protein [Gammaproteobacteria bacterium]
MNNPPEQTITYSIRDSLYLNVCDRCTLACGFCPKYRDNDVHVYEYNLGLETLPSAEEIIAEIDDPAMYEQVVFCGFGEPTLRLAVVLQVARFVKENNGFVRLNTDGLANRFHKRNVLPEMQGRIDAISVSMNAQNEAVYNMHCHPAMKGSFDAMLSFLKAASDYIPQVTATAINGLEGVDIDACEKLAKACGVEFRRRELDVVG